MSYKKRVQTAIENFSKKAYSKPRSKKNERPEAVVVLDVLNFFQTHGCSVERVESKAVFSRSAGRYLRGQTTPGFSDIAGVMPNGRALYIECKAPGRINTLRPEQLLFLIQKAKLNAFVAVVDSVHRLQSLIDSWYLQPTDEAKQKFLIESLPKLQPRFQNGIRSSESNEGALF